MALAHLSGPGQTVCSTATLRRSRTCLFHHTRDSRGTCCQCPSRSPTREFPLTRNRTASSFPATLAAPRCQRSLWRAHGARTRSGRVDWTGESESRDRRDPGRQHADDREAHREHAVQIRLYLAGTDRGVGQRKRAWAKRAEPALKRRSWYDNTSLFETYLGGPLRTSQTLLSRSSAIRYVSLPPFLPEIFV